MCQSYWVPMDRTARGRAQRGSDTPVGRASELIRRILIGARIPTEREAHERIGVLKGLPVFASDNISSSAYATEEIMRVLVLAGAGALALTLPITMAIIAVL